MKYHAKFEETHIKDEIIVYAKNKREAQMLVENYSSKIDWDYGDERVKIYDWPPKEKFDKDNTLIIKRNEVIKPVLKPLLTFSGELFNDIWPPDNDTDLAVLEEKDIKKLRKDICNLIKKQIKVAKIRDLERKKKNL